MAGAAEIVALASRGCSGRFARTHAEPVSSIPVTNDLRS
jgi:hypothetical protein